MKTINVNVNNMAGLGAAVMNIHAAAQRHGRDQIVVYIKTPGELPIEVKDRVAKAFQEQGKLDLAAEKARNEAEVARLKKLDAQKRALAEKSGPKQPIPEPTFTPEPPEPPETTEQPPELNEESGSDPEPTEDDSEVM